MEGWIKLHRKLNETSFKNKPLVVALFVHLLLNANHQDKKFYWNNEELTIKSGQLLTGRKELSKQTGISPQSIRTAMMVLKSTNTITIKSTNRFSIISILNWDKYQNESTSTLTSKLTNNQPTTNQQLTTNKNEENEENEEKELYMPNKKPNGLRISRSQLIAFLKEFPGLTTSEAKEQVLLCNNYMAISSVVYTNPGLFFRGWLKRYMTEKKKREYLEKKERESVVNSPEVSEEQAKQNIERLTKLKEELKIKGVIS
jgi:hypothetical protein